jgi:hypothetical protein
LSFLRLKFGSLTLLTPQKLKSPGPQSLSAESRALDYGSLAAEVLISLSHRQSYRPFGFDRQDHLPLTAAALYFDTLSHQAGQKAPAIATELGFPV